MLVPINQLRYFTWAVKGQRLNYSPFQTIEGEEFEFSDGFINLHTKGYEKIVAWDGFILDDCRQSVEIVYQIFNAEPLGLKSIYHPIASKTVNPHSFHIN